MITPRQRYETPICVALFGFSMWLRGAFPILGLGHGEWDDMLFVRMSAHIRDGDWLGPYGSLTLAKGSAFATFVAANELVGIPFKLTEHFLYLGASWFFAESLARVIRTRWAFLVLFAILALNPIAWSPEVGGRLVRENLYSPLAVFLLGMAFRLYLGKNGATSRPNRREWLLPLAFGATGGVFWVTREEGLWIVPALVTLIAAWLARTARGNGPRGTAVLAATHLAIPIGGFLIVVLAINTLNHHYYGTFRNNDFRSRDFQAAYGALSRIEHDDFARFVVFPKDARARAYSVSSAARELAPSFEGERGRFWAGVGCEQTSIRRCDEILSGWFMWALREAVERAGHYRTAREAESFYLALAAEIDGACDAGRIPCGPARRTLVPPWRSDFAAWSVQSAIGIGATLLTLGHMSVRIVASVGTDEQLGLMARMTHYPLATRTDPHPAGIRYMITRAITESEHLLHMIAAPAGLMAFLIVVSTTGFTPAAIGLLSILVAVATRIALLAFLDATSIPSNNLLYLSPAVPFSLVFGPVALMVWARTRWPILQSSKGSPT